MNRRFKPGQTFRFGNMSTSLQPDDKECTEDKKEDAHIGEPDMSTDGKEDTKLFCLGQADIVGKANEPFQNKASQRQKKENLIFEGLLCNTLQSPWRNVTWSKEAKEELMNVVRSYKPVIKTVSEARVLLLGPVGAGKSSFISSFQSVFSGRVLNRVMVGSSSSTSTSFTKKFQSFAIRDSHGAAAVSTGLVCCDSMATGDGEITGLTLHDVLCIIKGHVPEGHRFSPEEPFSSETAGYIKMPSLSEKIHCVAFVIDASKLDSYPKGMSRAFQQLREHIGNLGVHQVALLTHVDKVCINIAQDVTQVYKSKILQQQMMKAEALLGMAMSYIVPVKNYSSQLDLDESTDILLLRAVDHILQYVDLYFQDSAAKKLSL